MRSLAPGRRSRRAAEAGCPADGLRFLTDFAVPFTNTLVEQDLRMKKLRRKISGCFRIEQGARDFATLHSALSTARQQGCHAIEALLTPPDELFASLKF